MAPFLVTPRSPLPAGPFRNAALVALGVVAVGGGSAIALALSARALPASSFAVFATWTTVANLIGLAFVAVEMYLPRLVLAVRSEDRSEEPVLRTFTLGTLSAVAVLAAAVVASAGWSVPALFGDSGVLLVLALTYLLAMSLQTLQRGVAVGRGSFRVFPLQMGVDGVTRAAGSTVLLMMGADSAVAFAVVLTAAAAAGVLAGTFGSRGWFRWRGPRAAVAIAPLGLLAAASLGPLVVNNAAVPWLSAGGQVPALTIGAVAGALLLSRIPTLLVGAAYGPVLSPLAQCVDAGDRVGFVRLHRRASAGAALVAVAFAALFALGGPLLLELYLGPSFQLSRGVLAAMGASSGLMFVCVVEQAALVALSSWSFPAYGWAAGMLAFVMALIAPGDAVTRATAAVLLAPLAAAAVMVLARRRTQDAAFATSRPS